VAGDGAEADGDTVPGVDGGDGVGEVDDFFFTEVGFDGPSRRVAFDAGRGETALEFCASRKSVVGDRQFGIKKR
jgi:hypothetical protein